MRTTLKCLAACLMLALPTLQGCGQGKPGAQNTVKQVSSIEQLQSSGKYTGTGTIYTDAALRQTDKAHAVYYLEKKLLGPDMVLNSGNTNDYWADRQYFENTNIVKYIYKYYSIDTKQLKVAAVAGETRGKDFYVFNGDAFTSVEDGKVKEKFTYAAGKLNGPVTVADASGNGNELYGYHMGKKYSNVVPDRQVFKALAGRWEAEIENNAQQRKVTQVFDMQPNGLLYFWKNIYYNFNSDRPEWQISTDGSKEAVAGSWLFTPESGNSGKLQLSYRGEVNETGSVKIVDRNTLEFETLATMDKDMPKHVVFKRMEK